MQALHKVLNMPEYIPPPLPSCMPVSVAEHASLSLNMPIHPWKCLDKLFGSCQGSQYAKSSYMFDVIFYQRLMLFKFLEISYVLLYIKAFSLQMHIKNSFYGFNIFKEMMECQNLIQDWVYGLFFLNSLEKITFYFYHHYFYLKSNYY